MSEEQNQERKAQGLQAQYNQYQELLTELQTQQSSVSSQMAEHQVVEKTLGEIPAESRQGRKCFKMIGGVLVEKSVDDVIKLLKEEKQELQKTSVKLENEVASTKKAMEQWMAKNKVKVVRK